MKLAVLALLACGVPTWIAAGVPAIGDRGETRTALHGDRVETLPVEFLGTFENFAGPGYDLHLVRLLGEVAEQVGVASGMSGSPVYFDGELLGALSYRISGGGLPGDPVAGVTPIADLRRAGTPEGAGPAGDEGNAVPIGTPVVAAGVHGAARRWLQEALAPHGLILASGGSPGDADAPEPAPLEPGSPVGVELVRGDMSIAATGTVTAIEDGRVYAFGHPFLGLGRVELPMTSARVVHTLADLAGSVKLAQVGGEIGTIVDDRLTGIVGRFDRRARMIPVSLEVEGGAYGRQEFSFEVSRTRQFVPLLAGMIVVNALVSNTGYDQDATLFAEARLGLRELPELRVATAQAGAGLADPSVAVAATLQQTLGLLWQNRFSEVDVESIDLRLRVEPGVRSYRVESLNYDRGPVRPGQSLRVQCVLRRYRGDLESRELEVPIPEGARPGERLVLAVGPPDELDRLQGPTLVERLGTARDLGQVVETLNDRGPAQRLTAVLYRRAGGVVTRGALYENLPPSAERLLGADVRTGASRPTRNERLARTWLELDGPVEGGVAVILQVEPGVR